MRIDYNNKCIQINGSEKLSDVLYAHEQLYLEEDEWSITQQPIIDQTQRIPQITYMPELDWLDRPDMYAVEVVEFIIINR